MKDGPITCSFLVPTSHYFVQEFNYGLNNRQPHNFIQIDDVNLQTKVFKRSSDDRRFGENFMWLVPLLPSESMEIFNSFAIERKFEASNDTFIIFHTSTAKIKMEFRNFFFPSVIKNESTETTEALILLPGSEKVETFFYSNFP